MNISYTKYYSQSDETTNEYKRKWIEIARKNVTTSKCQVTYISNPIYSYASKAIKLARLIFPFHVLQLPGVTLSNSEFPLIDWPAPNQLNRRQQ